MVSSMCTDLLRVVSKKPDFLDRWRFFAISERFLINGIGDCFVDSVVGVRRCPQKGLVLDGCLCELDFGFVSEILRWLIDCLLGCLLSSKYSTLK